MERLLTKLDQSGRALESLAAVIGITHPAELERDAAIQRFEYSVELIWKAAKEYLYTREGLDLASPKSVMRALRESGTLSMEETAQALQMIDDRNLTAHTYNESLAAEIYRRLPGYHRVMSKILAALRRECGS